MTTPIWSKVTDKAKTLAGSAEAEAEKLKHWAMTGEDKVNDAVDKAQSKGNTLPVIGGIVGGVILLVFLAWLIG